jgi:hypothetical protein
MIKEPKINKEQDVYSRRVYVIRAKKELIELILKIDPSCIEEVWVYKMPTVVMTEEVPFERDIEGWRKGIKNKCKEAYIRENIQDFPLSVMEKPDRLLKEMDILLKFFDNWWIAEEAEDCIEILDGSWKTDKCFEE